MNYSSSLRYLYSLQKFGIKLGLRKIRSLLEHVGKPHEQFRSIHIAGTNGKGSTAAMIASVLQEGGYKVGLYTSPHLINFTERIKVNGEMIDPKTVARYTELLKPSIRKLKCTFFEATTAVAFLHFAQEKVDLAVVETGLGGRLDATNVVKPLLSIITSVGLDHTEHLGDTLVQIAKEKAGIIKEGVPCLIGRMEPAVEDQIRTVAGSRGAQLVSAASAANYEIARLSFDSTVLNLVTNRTFYRKLLIGLPGAFQAENARLAVLALEMLSAEIQSHLTVSLKEIRQGLKNVRRNTGIRGRLETVRRKPHVVLDVAHNPDGVIRLVDALRKLQRRKAVVVFGVMRDKDYGRMLMSLKRIASEVIAVSPKTERALSSKALYGIARHLGIPVSHGETVKNGLAIALKKAGPFDTILITGSHYVVGEALEAVEGKGSA